MRAQTKIINSNVSDKLEIEVGDVKQPDIFYPQVKIKRWNNEVNASFRLVDNDLDAPQVSTKGKSIRWKKQKREAHFYETKINTFQDYKDLNLGRLKKEDIGDVRYSEEPFPHILINNQIWGRDDARERQIRRQKAKEAFGDVLIVGLGLGVINEYLFNNPRVTSITIVEFSQEVIDLVTEKYPERLQGVNLIKADFYDLTKANVQKFDYIWGDIFHNITAPYFNNWEKFLSVSSSLLKVNGVVDGRIKESYENTKLSNFDKEGYEFEIVLKERPLTNKIEFSLQTKGLKFYYQPELTQIEKDSGCLRLPRVVGSYAVYHDSKKGDFSKVGGKNYRAGKAFHIFRPKIEDAEGNWVWGELNVDLENEKLIVTIPQDFLNNAIYPIRHAAGLTFGYLSEGGTDHEIYNTIAGSVFSGAVGVGTSISVYFTATSNVTGAAVKCNLYKHSDLSPETNGETEVGSSGDDSWVVYDFNSAPNLTAIDYVIVAWGKWSKNSEVIGYDTGDTDQGHIDADEAFNGWKNPLVPVHEDREYSIYCTYTGPETKTFTADGIVKATQTKSFTADGVIQEEKTKTFTADGVVRAEQTKTFTADGIVFAVNTKTFTADGVVRATTDKTFTADGIIKEIKTTTFTTDGIIKQVVTEAFTVDGIVKATQTETFDIDGHIISRETHSYTIDGIIKQVVSESFTTDGHIISRETETFTVDAVIKEQKTHAFTTDGIVLATYLSSFTADGIVQITGTKSFSVDGIVKVINTQTFTSDAVVVLRLTATFTTDGIIKQIVGKTFTADGVVLVQTTETFTIDAIVLAETIKTLTADGIVLVVSTETFTADGIVLIHQTETFTADGIVKVISTKTFTTDAVIKSINTKTFTIDGRIGTGIAKTFTLDGVVVYRLLSTFTVDGRVSAFGTIESFTADGIVSRPKFSPIGTKPKKGLYDSEDGANLRQPKRGAVYEGGTPNLHKPKKERLDWY